jgi:hypothetical protein
MGRAGGAAAGLRKLRLGVPRKGSPGATTSSCRMSSAATPEASREAGVPRAKSERVGGRNRRAGRSWKRHLFVCEAVPKRPAPPRIEENAR